MKLHLIVNPNAGRKRGGAAAARAEEAFVRAGAVVSTVVSTWPGEAVELARRIGAEMAGGDGAAGDAAVVAVGGDGTLFEVVNGLFAGLNGAAMPVLAQIPVGTGNSFIRDLDMVSVDEAVEAVLGGKTRAVDVGRFSTADGSWYFVNLLGMGFVSSVAHGAGRYKKLGALSYVIAVVQETLRLSSSPVVLTVDGKRIERDGIFVEVCNSRYTGGKMMMAPGAVIDDGLFDVVVMSRANRRKVLSLFPRIFAGTHVEDPLIEVFRGRSVRVETGVPWLLTPDGETFGTTPISVEMIPRGLRFFAAR